MSRHHSFALIAVALSAAEGVFAQGRQAPPPPTPVRQPARPPMLASVDPKLLSDFRYRLVGPMRGGRVTTVTGVPSQPTTFYMGVASGGVWKTTNNGQSWLPITHGKVPVASAGSIAVAESNPNVIYFGTGSDGVRSNVSTGRGIYKTTDGGNTWTFAGLYNAGQIGAVRIHPTNPDIVWVSATGNIFGKNADRGIFKTTDGGRTWRKTLYVNDSTGGNDIEIQPGNPNVLFAAVGRLERKPWTIISGSTEGGLFKSIDAGETWTKMGGGLPSALFGKANIAVTAANPQRVYALIEAAPGGGMYRSDNAGQTWTSLPSPAGMIARPFYYTTLGADPTNADVFYGGAESFYKSADGGRTYAQMSTPHGDNHDIWVNPKDGNIMIQANDGGANVSTNAGQTWSTQQNQPTSEIYGVWMDDQIPYKIYGAQQDGSTWIISSGANEMRNGPGCETGPIMPHPKDPNIVYGSCKGIYEYTNLATGVSRTYKIGGEELYGQIPKDMKFRFQRVSPMETSPHDPEVLYYGSQFVHRTRDKGVNWEKISPDLTAFDPCCQFASGGPITRDNTGEEFYSTLYAITESPLTRGVIWTGANDGPFALTRDNGATWKKVTPPDLPKGGRVAWIDASPHRPGSAYYAVYRYLLGDFAPYIYKTEDYGATWKRLTDGKNGIAADNPTRVVREDPFRPGLLYAGTEFGIFISFDDGGHWQPFNQNMPSLPINDIKIHRQDIVVATQGHAIWVMDNISPIEQIAQGTASAPATLFRPRDAFRIRPGGGGGGGRGGGGGGAGAPAAGGRGARGAAPGGVGADAAPIVPPGLQLEYPTATGAEINYYLSVAPSAPITMEIRDAAGALVRTLSSETASAAPTVNPPTTPVSAADSAMAVGRDPVTAGGRGGAGAGGAAGAAGARGGRGAGGAGAGGAGGAGGGGGGGGRGGRGGAGGGGGAAAPGAQLPKIVGLNRFYWDMNHMDGSGMVPPGNYTVKLAIGSWSSTQPMTLKVDPKLAAEGITAADLQELRAHNIKTAQLSADASALSARLNAARNRLRTATGPAADTAAKVNAIAKKWFGPDEGVRYGVPGLVTHVNEVRSMTPNGDQKVGNQAKIALVDMRKALEAVKAELDRVLGPGR